jgi:flagellar hook-associated protein FlgK
MPSLTAVAHSGMQAAQLRLGASAHNVANLNTPHFQRHVVDQQAAAGGAGVKVAAGRSAQEGVALEQEAVEQLSSTYAFNANLQVLRTGEAMAGALLDVRA